MATRLGPRSFTLHTPSLVCSTESSGWSMSAAFELQLVLHRLDPVDLLRHLLGAAAGVGIVDAALERHHAVAAVYVDGEGLQAHIVGEGAFHLAGEPGVLRALLGAFAGRLALLRLLLRDGRRGGERRGNEHDGWFQGVSPMAGSRRARGRPGMDHARLVDRWAANLLLQAGPLALFERRQLDRTAALRGAIQRADYAHVGQAFVRARLRVAVLQHAVGEIQQLGGELVALGEAPFARVAVDGEPVLERRGVFIR